ncbi:metallophosphoesterase family protein [Marinibacterium profundimaris]|nr:DNA repair exonuclease [Marinibacterium profundimaris]
MFRFLHTADLHIDSPLRSLALRDADLAERVGSATRTALSRIVDACLEHEVHALLIAGDLFDGDIHSMKTAAFVIAQFERLDAAGIPVFLIRGNHDAESQLTREIDLPPNVTLFTGHGGVEELPDHGVAIHGISFARPSAPESLLPKLRPPVPGRFNIGLLHTSLAGAPGHDVYAPCSIADLTGHGFDYWALGHVHGRRIHAEAPLIVMPGMPQGRDIGEAGPKSATLVTVTEGRAELREVPTSAVVFERVTCDLGDIDDWRDARAAVMGALRAATPADEGWLVARVELRGQGDLAWRIRRDLDLFSAQMAEDAQAEGRMAIEKIEITLQDRAEAAAHGGARADLVSLLHEVCETPAFRDRAIDMVRALSEDLPPEIRGDFGRTEEDLAAVAIRILDEGAEEVAARLSAGAAAQGEEG